ncbi:UNVERIFIED_CONTAM: hypothetical protein HDU68_004662 [Siphonaria sp. JEL0065]|nr:hypothetical protein HDU68_004662 [Siphonaria sp. JEL0065]
MRAKTLQINWHDKMPIFSVAFNPRVTPATADTPETHKLATAGGDHNIRIWNITLDEATNTSKHEFGATLNRHSSVVNCIRWSPREGILASGGDDGTLILWQQSDKKLDSLDGDDADNKEHWKILSILRGCSSDIYDIVWSPKGTHLLAGCVDNSARIWDVKENKCIHTLTEHSNFVQGVSWDPLDLFIASQSSDRSVNIYKLHHLASGMDGGSGGESSDIVGLSCCARQSKITTVKHVAVVDVDVEMKDCVEGEGVKNDVSAMLVDTKQVVVGSKKMDVDDADYVDEADGIPAAFNSANAPVTPSTKKAQATPHTTTTTTMKLFHDDTLSSFFRRLQFSPDGSLLVAPAGLYRATPKDVAKNVVYVFSRENLRGEPIARLTGFKKPAIAICFSPIMYQPRGRNIASTANSKLNLPYRMIFAVATQDSVVVYDTSSLERPLAVIANLHFGTLTDVACSELGVPVERKKEEKEEEMHMETEEKEEKGAELKTVVTPLAPAAAVNVLHSGLIKKKKPIVLTVPPATFSAQTVAALDDGPGIENQ